MNENLMIIANRIRELREVLGFTAEEVAEKVNVSVETYMKYETAESDIPIGVLYGLSAVFQVDPTDLLTGEAPKMRNFTITRKGEGVNVTRTPEYSFTSLAHKFVGRDMEPMLVRVLPTRVEPALLHHAGNEFNYVVKGKLRLKINDNEFILEEGDSAYFDSMLPHSQSAVGGETVFLTVINDFTVWGARSF